MFEVKSREKNHESFTVNKSHILSVVDRKGTIKNISVEDYLNLPEWEKKDNWRGYRVAIEYPEKEVVADPYWLGLWLGDGSSYDVRITNTDPEIITYLEEYAKELNLNCVVYETKDRCNDYAITGGTKSKVNILTKYLQDEKLLKNKHIPADYSINSREIRLQLLAGLIDSDGHRSTLNGKENVCEISTSKEAFAKELISLFRSLGFRASYKVKTTNFNTLSYRVTAYGDFSVVPTKVKHKQWQSLPLRENPLTFGFDLVSKGEGDYYGFTIDGDHLFVLGDYTVTHNTEIIAMICAGCMIILPKLAEMFPKHEGLQKYKEGLWIGIFAPSNEQSDTTYSRMKSMIQSQHAKMILADEDLDIGLATKGRVIALTNGSFCKPTSAAKTANIESKTYQLVILEEAQDLDLRVVRKSIGPMLADKDGCFIKVGTANDKKSDFSEAIRRNKRRGFNHFGWTWRVVAKVNKNYGNFIKKEMERIGAESDEFKMSYECIFILERGMFMTEEQFEAMANNSPKGLDFLTGSRETVIIGIDFAKKGDSTVLTAGLPNYSQPYVDDDGEERYTTRILDWLELEGDYEVQFWRMVEFIDRYNVACIVGDSTGNGDAIVDRLKNHYLDRCDVIGIVFSNQSKDMIYKNLQKEILHDRIWLPTTSGAVRSTRYTKFKVQMCDLEKEWKGRFMVCHHPDAKDAKDDFPDSLALMEWGVYQGIMSEMEEYDNPLFNKRRSA